MPLYDEVNGPATPPRRARVAGATVRARRPTGKRNPRLCDFVIGRAIGPPMPLDQTRRAALRGMRPSYRRSGVLGLLADAPLDFSTDTVPQGMGRHVECFPEFTFRVVAIADGGFSFP